MERVIYLGQFCQHGFRSITWKPLKISQPNLLPILSKELRCAFWY